MMVQARSLTDFTLSAAEGFEMTIRRLVIPTRARNLSALEDTLAIAIL
jgi:hypothetical protein